VSTIPINLTLRKSNLNRSKDNKLTLSDMRRGGFPNHDIQRDVLFLALQINLLDNLEPESPVNDWVDII
jgi:hypothetical protein